MASLSSLLLLLTITLMLFIEGTHEHRTIPSKEEYKEMERQLKAINKPAIMSFKTEHGDIFDCVEIHKQLAFDHPILKNHSVQLKPTSVPEWDKGNNISERSDPFLPLEKGINCPDGTVIIRRTTKQDLMHVQRLKSMGFDGPRPFLTEQNCTNDSHGKYYLAKADFGPKSITGVKANVNLWEPQVSKDQVSLAFIAVGGGSKQTFASITFGWMVNPTLYQDSKVRLYVSWTIDGNEKGCYDKACPGFVQVSKTIPLGGVLQPVSTYNSAQYELLLSLYQDRTKGDWWIAYRNENVGYLPASLFKSGSLTQSADYAAWGGQVYNYGPQKSPAMGSGHWPGEGFNKAAFVNSFKIIDGSGTVLDPEVDSISTYETSPNCYKAIYFHDGTDEWSRGVFYGGPGGCI